VAVGWTVATVVQSVATVTFTGPPIFGLYFGLVGLVAALSARREEPDPDRRPPHTEDAMLIKASAGRASTSLARLHSDTATGFDSRGRT
jgi:hypothetical protein